MSSTSSIIILERINKMFKITASLEGKIEEFQMPLQSQVDSATLLLEGEGYTILMVSERA